jgi:uncharacterized sulfatase
VRFHRIHQASLRFLKGTAAALVLFSGPVQAQAFQAQPNILWITSEDNGPHLGCYGDEYATTPNLDRLSARSLRFARVWSNAPVCAPARTTLITGVHAPSLGAENMRSKVKLPEGMRLLPQWLREAGYYCSNRSKEDYNFHKPGKVWDVSGGKGHWRQRSEGQPFFAVFNFTVSHESRIRTRPHEAIHDPKKVTLPAYHPDTPEVRQDWAQYHDKVSEMDAQVGGLLAQLDADGLAEDTIVFYFSDHGSGMPRSKRWPYNSGLHVPMLVHFPKRWAHLAPQGYASGGVSNRLVSFVDLAPTMLSLAGLDAPEYMQGAAFAGEHARPAPSFMHGYRGRMDERYDLVRSVTDGRFIFIRNYMPHRIYGQYLDYMFKTPTTRIWRELYDQGKLQPPQTYFWETKPPLELYDLQTDPDEVDNLAHDSKYRAVRERLQDAQREQAMAIRDLGFLPEGELHARAGESAPMTWGEKDERYDIGRILAMAERASSWNTDTEEPEAQPHRKWMQDSLTDRDSAVRYWAALGLGILGPDPEHPRRSELGGLLDDPASCVRIVAAELLIRHGSADEREKALKTLLDCADMTRTGIWDAVLALGTLDALGLNDPAISEALGDLPLESSAIPDKFRGYVTRLLKRMTSGN